jgi:hypothetical protein
MTSAEARRVPAEDDIKRPNDNIAELRAPFEASNP